MAPLVPAVATWTPFSASSLITSIPEERVLASLGDLVSDGSDLLSGDWYSRSMLRGWLLQLEGELNWKITTYSRVGEISCSSQQEYTEGRFFFLTQNFASRGLVNLTKHCCQLRIEELRSIPLLGSWGLFCSRGEDLRTDLAFKIFLASGRFMSAVRSSTYLYFKHTLGDAPLKKCNHISLAFHYTGTLVYTPLQRPFKHRILYYITVYRCTNPLYWPVRPV